MKKIIYIIFTILLSINVFAANKGDVVFSEIDWSGTQASSGYEWLELYNTTGGNIDLTNWTISDGSGIIADLSDTTVMNTATITAGKYYLIEYRSTSEPVKQAIGDIISDFEGLGYSKLSNDGEHLYLKDGSGNIIDDIDCSSGWFAGATGGVSMEKKILGKDGNDAGNWANNDLITINGHDYLGNLIYGTPRHPNSVGPIEAAIYLQTSVSPSRIEIIGGSPETATVTVKLLDENYSIYTSSPSLNVIVSASPIGIGHFQASGDTIGLTLISGIATIDYGSCLSPSTITLTATNTGVSNVLTSDLDVLPIDISGPTIIGFTPENDVPLRSVQNIPNTLTLSDLGGIYNTQTMTIHYKIYSSTGSWIGTSSTDISYDSGGTLGDNNVIYGYDILFSGTIDFTNGGSFNIPNLSTIGIWITGTDYKGNSIDTINNSESDFYKTLTVKDVKLLVTEVDFIGTLGEDFVEIYCTDDGNNGNGVNINGFYIDDLDSINGATGGNASVTDLDANADKKLGELTVKTGDYIVLLYDNGDDWKDSIPSGSNIHIIYTSDSGLTDSDEQIGIFTPAGELMDIVCWADQSGSISDDDFKKGFVGSQWNISYGSPTTAEEIDCVDSDFSKGSIVRDVNNTDTNDKADWKDTMVETPGGPHPQDTLPAAADIVISEVYFYSPSGYPDWVELYCKNDGNGGNGVDIGGCFIEADNPLKIFKVGTKIRTGQFIIITEGNSENDESTAGNDNILTVFDDSFSLSSTDENIDLRDFSGNIKDAVLWAQRDSEAYKFPVDANGDLISGAQVIPAITYDISKLIDISYIEYSDFYEILNSTDAKLGEYQWVGKLYKFFPNLAKYPDFPGGTVQPDPNYIYDWVYAVEGAIPSINIKEEYSITRDEKFTDTNTLDDWAITDKPTMGRPSNEIEVPGGKILDIKVEPRTFVNDGSIPTRLYTTISMEIASEGVLTLRIYDMRGKVVKTLAEKTPVPPGPYSVKWWGNNDANGPLPIGVYIVYIELRNETRSITKKAIVAIGKKM
ncbi:lamin tail domain-containing protein [bacterium]|nr:lamin tail domain-containing protein [bacterium]